MRRNGKPLEYFELNRHMNFKIPVTVSFHEIIETGLIEFHNKEVVKINGNYFVKATCLFWSSKY